MWSGDSHQSCTCGGLIVSCWICSTGGVSAVARHAAARLRGARRVQIEPHLSITAAASAEWIPIKPKTDAAFMFALIHVLLHEHPRARLDVPFLTGMTSSPYLVGPHGYYLRDPESQNPLFGTWRQAAVVFVPAMPSRYSGAACR
jgi:phenylacetyl-CoA:acceptor oxidoreductase